MLVLAMLVAATSTSSAQAATARVPLGTATSFAVLAGSTITNTGSTVINGDLGLHPGTSVTGFPPGTVNGATHINNGVAQQAKADLVTAYNDAASRSATATLPPDAGGLTLTSGVYRTGGVATLGLTGNLTLDGQGDANAVFIFQVASSLTTATDSRVTLINGAQSCNVYWQLGESGTFGTRTAFKGNVLAMTSISLDDAVVVDGRLLARNGAVTLINDTVTRAGCAAGTGDNVAGDGGTGGAAPGTGGSGGGTAPGATGGPVVRIFGLPPVVRMTPNPDCTVRDFRARIRLRDIHGIRRATVYLDGKVIKRTTRARFSIAIHLRGLSVGNHTIKVVARDKLNNRSITRRRFGRCTLGLAAPSFTG